MSKDIWNVQQARIRFGELIERARTNGPQLITRHGRPVVKVIATDASARAGATDKSFTEFLLSVPKSDLAKGLPKMSRRSRSQSMFEELE